MNPLFPGTPSREPFGAPARNSSGFQPGTPVTDAKTDRPPVCTPLSPGSPIYEALFQTQNPKKETDETVIHINDRTGGRRLLNGPRPQTGDPFKTPGFFSGVREIEMKMRQPRSPGGPEPFDDVDEAEPETKGPSVAKSLMVGAGVGLIGAARDFVFVGASQLGKNALSAGMGAMALTNPGGAMAVSMTATCVMGMKPTMMAADTFSDAMGIQNSWLRMGIKVIPLGLALGLPGYFAFTGAIGTGASLAIALSSRLFSNLLRDTLNQMTAGVLPSVELVDAKGQALTGPQALVIEKRRVTLASLFYMGGIVATGWGGGSTALQKALNTHHGLDPGGAGSASVLARLGQALGGATGACWMEAFDSLQGVLLATTLALRAGGGVKCKPGNLQYLKQAAYDFDDLSTRISMHSGMRFNIALFSTGLGDYAKAIFPKDSPEAATLVKVSEFMAIFTEFRGYLVSQGQLAGLQKQHPEADLLAALEPYFGLTGPQLEFIVIDDLQHPGHTDFQAPPTSPLEFMARQSMTGAQYNDRKTKAEKVFAGRIDPLTPTEGVQASLFGADITVVDNEGGAVRFTVCEASERQTVLTKLGRNFRVLDQYKGQENVIEIPQATYVLCRAPPGQPGSRSAGA